jgi:repressor LexA
MHKIQQALLMLSEREDISNLGYREIARKINVVHPQQVIHHLNQLQKKGLLNIANRKVHFNVKQKNNLIPIPIYGSANCGPASIIADNNIHGTLMVSSNMLKNRSNKVFAIKAIGNSMNQANIHGKNIFNGDLVLVDPNDQNVHDGDYVLSIIEDMANVKKFHREKQNKAIVLYSESSEEFPPIYLAEGDNYNFCGKVFDIVKSNTNPNKNIDQWTRDFIKSRRPLFDSLANL